MPNQPAIARADVVIAGGGFAGLALALALRQSLGAAFKVIVADPAFAANARPDLRASAIAAAARRMFETLGVWDAVAPDAQPILDMVVTDSKLNDAVRPVFLTFAGEIEAGEPFAHMIENAPLNAALAAKARGEGVERRGRRPRPPQNAAPAPRGRRAREGPRRGDRAARHDRDALRAPGWTHR